MDGRSARPRRRRGSVSAAVASGVTFWWDGPADGGTNMAADEWLAAEADRRGGMLVRFYGWTPTTVSLGGFQRIADVADVAGLDGVPVVRRPSGGGAIVHGSDLTYAAAVPRGHPWGGAPQAFYDALHAAMAAVLAEHGVVAAPFRPAADTPRADGADGFFCFDRRAAGDLVLPSAGGAKVMGSAQRRLAGVVLQHGSLLVRGNDRVSGAARHPGIEDLVMAKLPAVRDLAGAWVERIASTLGAKVSEQPGTFAGTWAEPIAAAAARFLDPRWTGRR